MCAYSVFFFIYSSFSHVHSEKWFYFILQNVMRKTHLWNAVRWWWTGATSGNTPCFPSSTNMVKRNDLLNLIIQTFYNYYLLSRLIWLTASRSTPNRTPKITSIQDFQQQTISPDKCCCWYWCINIIIRWCLCTEEEWWCPFRTEHRECGYYCCFSLVIVNINLSDHNCLFCMRLWLAFWSHTAYVSYVFSIFTFENWKLVQFKCNHIIQFSFIWWQFSIVVSYMYIFFFNWRITTSHARVHTDNYWLWICRAKWNIITGSFYLPFFLWSSHRKFKIIVILLEVESVKLEWLNPNSIEKQNQTRMMID